MGTCPFTNSGGPGGKAGPCSTKSCAIYMKSVEMCSFLAIGNHMIADRQARHYEEVLDRTPKEQVEEREYTGNQADVDEQIVASTDESDFHMTPLSDDEVEALTGSRPDGEV